MIAAPLQTGSEVAEMSKFRSSTLHPAMTAGWSASSRDLAIRQRLERHCGHGGIAVVHLARHVGHARHVGPRLRVRCIARDDQNATMTHGTECLRCIVLVPD